jgi:hypothetical protein
LLAEQCADVNSYLFGQLDRQDDFGATERMLALKHGYGLGARELLRQRASICAADNFGKTPLHLTCQSGLADLVKACSTRRLYVINVAPKDESSARSSSPEGNRHVEPLLCSADGERLQSALALEGNPPLMDTASSHNMYEIIRF